jgi:aryl-alcohol dehydrogenase-like predicted oxidoreductase
VLAQGTDIVPIPGSKHLSRLGENLAAAEIAFSDSELAAINAAAPFGAAAGERYGRAGMQFVNR